MPATLNGGPTEADDDVERVVVGGEADLGHNW